MNLERNIQIFNHVDYIRSDMQDILLRMLIKEIRAKLSLNKIY